MHNSFNQFWAPFGPLIGLDMECDAEAFEATKPAFVAAAFIEFAIIFLSFLCAALVPGNRPLRPTGQALTAEARAQEEASLGVFNALAVPGGGMTMFYVPDDAPDSQLKRRATAEVARWRMRPTATGSAIDLVVVAPGKHALLTKVTGGARYFTVYRVPSRALNWWRQANIDLGDPAPAEKNQRESA